MAGLEAMRVTHAELDVFIYRYGHDRDYWIACLAALESPFRERYIHAVTTQTSVFLCDPLEWDETLSGCFQDASRQAAELMRDVPEALGQCHRYWQLKQKVLRETYSITWFSPSEMNPGVFFD